MEGGRGREKRLSVEFLVDAETYFLSCSFGEFSDREIVLDIERRFSITRRLLGDLRHCSFVNNYTVRPSNKYGWPDKIVDR